MIRSLAAVLGAALILSTPALAQRASERVREPNARQRAVQVREPATTGVIGRPDAFLGGQQTITSSTPNASGNFGGPGAGGNSGGGGSR
jgi:hypothetical protein